MERIHDIRETSGAVIPLSIVSGALVLVGAFMPLIWLQYMGPGLMWRGLGMMQGGWGIMSGISIIGIVSGVLILLSGIMMHYNPTETRKWGILVLVFAVISLFGMGGFLIGAVLGIVAGILALSRS